MNEHAVSAARRQCVRAAILLAFSCTLAAQPAPPIPPNAAPPNTAPPPLPDVVADPDLEPKVTIIRREGQTVEEVRVGGQLKYVKVTPPHGRPYYLVPSSDGQRFTRSDPFGPALSVPLWELFSW